MRKITRPGASYLKRWSLECKPLKSPPPAWNEAPLNCVRSCAGTVHALIAAIFFLVSLPASVPGRAAEKAAPTAQTANVSNSRKTPSPDYSEAARAVQFNVKGMLNARVVTTCSNGTLQTWNKGIDGVWSGLATRQAADLMGSKGRVALPDDATFQANSLHPQVVLHFPNDDVSGNQVRFSDKGTADAYSFYPSSGYLSHLSLFFMSAFGTSEINVEIEYTDNTKEFRMYSIEDWAKKVPESEEKYFLSANLAKWGAKNTELEKDSHYLMGIELKPAPTKKVSCVTVKKPASPTTLTFWGATGYLQRSVPQIIAGNDPSISYEGRTVTTTNETVKLGYPGIVTRVNFRGTALNLHARTASAEMYLDVGVDGAPFRFLHVPRGDSDVSLAQNLSQGEHRVEIFKRVESAVGVLEVMALAVAGELLPAKPLPERRLMFLGDSFTAGQATTVEDGGPMDPSKAMRQNARLCYGRLLADRLHAQCHIIAYAGRGVMRDWQGVRAVRCAPEYYEYTLPDDVTARWEPKAYVPEAIGVCLGNNDFGDGVPDQTEYIRVYVEFVRKLRRDAPHAHIFLILSPSLTDEPGHVPLHTVQHAYFDEIVRRLADPHVQVVPVAHYPGVPGDFHPSGTAHRAIAAELEPVFRQVLKW